jgi:hypothetical protein
VKIVKVIPSEATWIQMWHVVVAKFIEKVLLLMLILRVLSANQSRFLYELRFRSLHVQRIHSLDGILRASSCVTKVALWSVLCDLNFSDLTHNELPEATLSRQVSLKLATFRQSLSGFLLMI